MSTEEETDLKDLAMQALELNGSLHKIRAQLRAELFFAINDEAKAKDSVNNLKSKQYLEVPGGQAMFYLLYDLLDYLNLDVTLSVFESESGLGSGYRTGDEKQKILEQLRLDSLNNNSGPSLLNVLQRYMEQQKTVQNNNNDSSCLTPNLSNSNNGLNATFIVQQPPEDICSNSSSSSNNSPKSNGDDKSKSSEKPSKSKNLLTELSPGQLNKSRVNNILPSLYVKDKENANALDGFDIEMEYEEDFMSGSEVDFSLTKIKSHSEEKSVSNGTAVSEDLEQGSSKAESVTN